MTGKRPRPKPKPRPPTPVPQPLPATHAEALAGDLTGLEPSSCPGALVAVGTFPDRVLSEGVVRDRWVTVYRCAACEARISASGGRVLNAYGPTLPPDAVLGLAAAQDRSTPRDREGR